MMHELHVKSKKKYIEETKKKMYLFGVSDLTLFSYK